MGAFAGGLLLAVAIFATLIVWSIRRHKDPELHIESDAPIDQLLHTLAGLTLGTAVDGNRAQILQNGAYFDVLLERMATAQSTVHFETFLWKDGVLGRRMAEALSARARAGVKVRVMLDGEGSRGIGKESVERMREAGCRVVFFHSRQLRNIGVFNDRDHRKLVVLDGREAFVGGHCVVDHWLGDAEDGKHYADVSLHLHGPIVHTIQGCFSENWAGETGELFVGEDVFPPLQRAGHLLMHAVFLKPENSAPAVKILHHTVICLARKRIWIQNPYFIPEPDAIDAFAKAVKRGVDVQVMVPSAGASDMKMVQHAAHFTFQKLLDSGVRIYEYQRTLLHQKVMTVDGIWCAVGSSNFDDRSFETNDEITLGFKDARLAAQLEEIFREDLKHCVELKADKWRKRGLFHRAQDGAFYLFNEVL